MADFSKQYCELYDEEMPHDFDIMEVFSTLEVGNYVPYICEGFGFVAIGNMDGQCVLAIPVEDESYGTVIWKLYEEVVR